MAQAAGFGQQLPFPLLRIRLPPAAAIPQMPRWVWVFQGFPVCFRGSLCGRCPGEAARFCCCTGSGRKQQALPTQPLGPGEALLRGQRCLARARGATSHSGHSRDVPSSSSSVAQPDTGPSLTILGGHCPAQLPAASCPPARPCGHRGQQPLCPGWSPPHWAQQSTGWSSFQSCHFFFISDFTCHGWEGAGAYPWLCPPCRHSVGWGRRAGGAVAGTGTGRYLLVGKAVQHGHQEALQGEPGVSPPLPSLSWGWDGLRLPQATSGCF